MKFVLRAVLALLILALLSTGTGVLAETATLQLPAALAVVDEEAFAGATALGRVVLPEGVREIRARAFAGSSLTEINLPASLEFIAEDAFAGCGLETVTAPAGTYAYDWAVAHGYIPVYDEFSVRISCSALSAVTGEAVLWRAEASGGTGNYSYSFRLYRDGELIEAHGFSESGDLTYTPEEAGSYHVVVFAHDGNSLIQLQSEALVVVSPEPEPLSLFSLTCESDHFQTTGTYIWTAQAVGGEEPYRFAFVLKQGSQPLDSRVLADGTDYAYTFFAEGDYTLTVIASDALGATAEPYVYAFTVDLYETQLTAVIRIYVDCDNDGNILRTNSKTGHYDLQFKNNDSKLSFDNYVYDSPVFSFYNGENHKGQIAVFEGDVVPRANVQLFTLEIPVSANKVKDMLENKLRDTYMDTENETQLGELLLYDVTTGPFTTYNIRQTNCFTALAVWCKWLGYDKLSEIVDASSSYTDYIAWRLYDRYGSSWNYMGQY